MEKIYLNEPYVDRFRANVTDITETDYGTAVILDRTAFYPESGGQPSDTGTIDGCRVKYVYEEDSVIYHIVETPPHNKTNVECVIDWDTRLDHMQQHCGQHILSAAFIEVMDAHTVGFHLGDEFVTIDIDVDSLSLDDAERVEAFANDIIFRNLEVKFHYPSFDELKNYALRKAPSVTENIRIVEIDGIDFSPCCGTHPAHTGDVGLIKIRKWEKSKNNIRVEFVCGRRALKDYTWKSNYINEIAALTSAKDTDTLKAVKSCMDELHEAVKENRLLKERLLSYEALDMYNNSDVIDGVHVVKFIFTGRDFKDVTSLANEIAKQSNSICLLGLKSDSARMVFTRSNDVDVKINEVFREVLPLIDGKGGGNPRSAQGGGRDINSLETAINSAYTILKNRYL